MLGRKIHRGGMKDGEEVLDILARDPHTARHISFELAQRFVSDNPPEALVDRMAQTFLKSDGDIREVLRTMIYSPEFWSKDAYHSKIKTPFELVASATRADARPSPSIHQPFSAQIPTPRPRCESIAPVPLLATRRYGAIGPTLDALPTRVGHSLRQLPAARPCPDGVVS